MYVCMYVCTICMFVCMYVCLYVCMWRYVTLCLQFTPIAITSPSLQHPLLSPRLHFLVCSSMIFSLRLNVIMRIWMLICDELGSNCFHHSPAACVSSENIWSSLQSSKRSLMLNYYECRTFTLNLFFIHIIWDTSDVGQPGLVDSEFHKRTSKRHWSNVHC